MKAIEKFGSWTERTNILLYHCWGMIRLLVTGSNFLLLACTLRISVLPFTSGTSTLTWKQKNATVPELLSTMRKFWYTFSTSQWRRCVVVLLSYNPYFLVQLSSQKRYICSAEEEVKVKRVGWLIVPRESLRFVPYGLSRHMAGTIFGTHSGLARFADPPQ